MLDKVLRSFDEFGKEFLLSDAKATKAMKVQIPKCEQMTYLQRFVDCSQGVDDLDTSTTTLCDIKDRAKGLAGTPKMSLSLLENLSRLWHSLEHLSRLWP